VQKSEEKSPKEDKSSAQVLRQV
jgi:hypothetical protein